MLLRTCKIHHKANPFASEIIWSHLSTSVTVRPQIPETNYIYDEAKEHQVFEDKLYKVIVYIIFVTTSDTFFWTDKVNFEIFRPKVPDFAWT